VERVDYTDTFITVAPDCSAVTGTPPPGESVAALSYHLIVQRPYELRTSDVIFSVWAARQKIPEDENDSAWAEFYAKPRPCIRSSDLGKRWGWGVHADQDGRLMVYPIGSAEYQALAAGIAPDGRTVKVRAAMRSTR